MNDIVDVLASEAYIRKLQMRYCRAVDRLDFDMLRACFHSDATLDYGFYAGGLEGFLAWTEQGLKLFTNTTHFTGNQLVEVNEDRASAENYTLATHRCEPNGTEPLRDFVLAIRYVDRLERRNGEWRIAHRAFILDWWRYDSVEALGTRPPGAHAGRRGQDDLSYSVLRMSA
jgi:hypothetical protein